MTQAFNLAQLANNLNTSGQLDATDGLTGLVTNANLASSGTASSSTYLRGDRTWASIGNVGKILQVVQTGTNTLTTITTTAGNTFSNYNGLNTTITPSSSSSRILVWVNIQVSINTGTGGYPKWRLVRNGSEVSATLGAANNSAVQASFGGLYGAQNCIVLPTTWAYVDSPASTSAQTYSLNVNFGATTRTGYVNQSEFNGNQDATTAYSTMILMEIGA